MKINYRNGRIDDLAELTNLAIKSWGQFQSDLTGDNWLKLYNTLTDENTYRELLAKSISIICTSDDEKVIGMAFLVPKGNPTDIYNKDWCYIRLLSVDPKLGGQGIGKKLTAMCIDIARKNGEKIIALHTSELMDKARHIYESLGFTILKEIDPRLGKKYWLYTLDLAEEI